MAALAKHIGPPRQGAQQALFWQAGKVLLPKGHVFLKPRRSAVRLIFKVGFFAGARLAKVWRFSTCERCVNVRNNSYVKKECQPVQHHVRALHGNDAACLASDDKGITHKGIFDRFFKKLVDHAVGSGVGVRLRSGVQDPEIRFLRFTHKKVWFGFILTQGGGGQRREMQGALDGLAQQIGIKQGVNVITAPNGGFGIVGQRRFCREPQFFLTTG